LGLEISGIAQHSGFSSDWQKFGRIWMRRRRLSGFYKLKIVWLATRFFYAVWTIVGIISWWTIAFFFYSFSVEECHSHSSEIRNLCLMKISSETLKKFVIPFQHILIFQKHGKFWSFSLEILIKPLVSEECSLNG